MECGIREDFNSSYFLHFLQWTLFWSDFLTRKKQTSFELPLKKTFITKLYNGVLRKPHRNQAQGPQLSWALRSLEREVALQAVLSQEPREESRSGAAAHQSLPNSLLTARPPTPLHSPNQLWIFFLLPSYTPHVFRFKYKAVVRV